ncbi:MAG: hypothetical protein ACRDG5_07845, partial [Anaerolineales bacterium]
VFDARPGVLRASGMITRPTFRRPTRGSPGYWVLIGSLVGIGLVFLALLGGAIGRRAWAMPGPTPVLIRLALPSATPVPPTATPTPEISPTPTVEHVEGGGSGIRLGILVEVVNAGGGLRFRQAPTLSGDILFLAIDSEVFRVDEGPVEADGYVWWFLMDAFSSDRQGWSVADFLRPLD